MYTQTSRTRTSRFFCFSAVMMLAAMMIAGCNQVQGNSSSGKSANTPPAPADKTYTVDGVSFVMKGIAAVTNGTVGHSSYSDNKPPE